MGKYVLIASVFGTVLYGLWLSLRKLWNRPGWLYAAYQSIHIVILIYFGLPFLGLIAGVGHRHSPVLMMVSLLWVTGVLLRLLSYWSQYRKHHRYVKMMVPCSVDRQEIAAEVAKKMRVRKNVQVFEGYALYTAELGGLISPRIYLPAAALTDEQFRDIVVHELTHYKNGDQWIRGLAVLTECFHWFNPIVKYLRRSLEHWDELYCDYCVCRRLEEKAGNYARTLFRMGEIYVSQKEAAKEAFEAAVGFNETNGSLLNRVEKVIDYSTKMKKQRHIPVAILFLVLSFTAVGTVLIANGKTEEPVNQVKYEEYVEVPEEPLEGIIRYRADSSDILNFCMTKQIWETGMFSAKEGQDIFMAVQCNPKDIELKVGIIEPDGTKRYVCGNGTILYTYALTKTGEYSAFIENETKTTVKVNWAYMTENP